MPGQTFDSYHFTYRDLWYVSVHLDAYLMLSCGTVSLGSTLQLQLDTFILK